MATNNGNGNTSESLPTISGPRLPYHPAVEERFGIDRADWKALVEAIYPGAQVAESVILALSYCKARKLDPFKRCVYIVPIWDKEKRRLVDTIWPGIGELRTTAHRTGKYAGRDKTEVGPMEKHTWGDVEIEFPSWAQVTVYRVVGDQRVAYAGPQVYWMETYSEKKGGAPNAMWQKRPRGQIDKCAEAAALRAAFPEEVGNDYIDAEAHLTKQVESREVEPIEKAGNDGVKERIKTRQQAAESPESEPEATTQEPEGGDDLQPPNKGERDEQTEAKVQDQKDRLQEPAAAVSGGNGKGKSNLF